MSESGKTTHRVLASRIMAVAVGIAATLACASPPPSGSYPEELSRWQGGSEADLISSWGMPQETHVLADGGRVIEYRLSEGDEDSCTTRFTLDPSGTIVRWWYAGVSCSTPKSS